MKKFMICLVVAMMYVTSMVVLPFFVPVAQASEYVLRSGDVLHIQIVGHDNIGTYRVDSVDSSPFIVRPDGKLAFPLVGEIVAAGKTIGQFTEELTKKLEEYIVKPRIFVNLTKLGTTRVFVLGEVPKPGVIELTKGHRALDALGTAGGFTRTGEARWVLLIRADTLEKASEAGQTEEGAKILEQGVTKLNFQRLISKGDLSQNVVLNEGDCLFVARNHRLDWFSILSKVIGDVYQIHRLFN